MHNNEQKQIWYIVNQTSNPGAAEAYIQGNARFNSSALFLLQ